MLAPKLAWKADALQPAPKGGHRDLPFEGVSVQQVELMGKSIIQPEVEVNGVLDLRKWCSPIENQYSAGSCVGNGVVGALEFLQIRNGMEYTDLSRLFVYYNARLQTQDTDKDDGTYIRLAFSTLTTLGTCSEKVWPYDLDNLFVRPSWAAYRDAYPHKITSYYRITETDGQGLIDAIKRALNAQHPVVFGMKVDSDFLNVDYRGIIDMPKSGRRDLGGHCMMIVGYDDNVQRWIVRNSWGTNWGDNGYCYIPYACLDACDANDFWVATLASRVGYTP